MNSFIKNAGVGAVIAICSFAIPAAQAGAVLTFNTTGYSGSTPGTITTSTAALNGTVSAMTINDFTGFGVSGAFNSAANGNWTLQTGNTFSWSNSAGGACGGDCYVLSGTETNGTYTVTGTLLTIALSAAPQITTKNGVGGAGNILVAIQNATSITAATQFLTDLNLTVSTSTVTGSIASAATGATGTGPFVWTAGGSSAMTVTLNGTQTTTPEPVTFLLFGTGLLAVAFMSRKKIASPVTVSSK